MSEKEHLKKLVTDLKECEIDLEKERSRHEIQMLTQVLSNADKESIELICQNIDLFENLLSDLSSKVGQKWENLIFNLEWTVKFNAILVEKTDDFSSDLIEAIKESSSKRPYSFNKKMLEIWKDSFGEDKQIQSHESLVTSLIDLIDSKKD